MAFRKYILFNVYDENNNVIQQDPYNVVSAVTKKAFDDSTIESNLLLEKDATYYTNGHYYVTLQDLKYINDTVYYLEVVVIYVSGGEEKTLKKYFKPRGIDIKGPDTGFRDRLAFDVTEVFLGFEFAEEITYTPKGQSSKDIRALIVRNRIEPGSEDQGRILQNQAEIYITNDDVYGVTSVDKGNDEVSFAEIEGGTPISWVVVGILKKDSGMWRLLLQK